MSVKKELIIPGTKCVVQHGKKNTFHAWPKNVANILSSFDLVAGSKFEITSAPFKRRGVSSKFVNVTITNEDGVKELETFYVCIRYDAEII